MRVMATLWGAKYDMILAAINTYRSIKFTASQSYKKGRRRCRHRLGTYSIRAGMYNSHPNVPLYGAVS